MNIEVMKMRKMTIGFLTMLLLLFSQVCFAASYELVYTDALGGQVLIDKDSVQPMQYKVWDCYKATTKVVFSKPMGNISYSVLYNLVNKETKEYALAYVENFDANNTLLSSLDKSGKLQWQSYTENSDTAKVIDKIIEIGKTGQ